MTRLLALLFLVSIVSIANAQDETLNEQYSGLKENSETYNEYKVIKESRLDEFWSNVNQEQSQLESEINSLNTKIDELNNSVESKEAAKISAEKQLAEMEQAATHISVLGIEFTKSSFKMTVGFTILGLVIGLGFVFFIFKQAYSEARKSSKLFSDLDSEYQDYRQKSLDKYVKLKRDYQTLKNQMAEQDRVSSSRKTKVTV